MGRGFGVGGLGRGEGEKGEMIPKLVRREKYCRYNFV